MLKLHIFFAGMASANLTVLKKCREREKGGRRREGRVVAGKIPDCYFPPNEGDSRNLFNWIMWAVHLLCTVRTNS